MEVKVEVSDTAGDDSSAAACNKIFCIIFKSVYKHLIFCHLAF